MGRLKLGFSHLALVVVALFLLVFLKNGNLSFINPSLECANSISCISNLSGEFEETKEATFLGKDFVVSQITDQIEERSVLGQTSGVTKRIAIDLSQQKLYAYEDNRVVLEFPVSTGKWGWTPTGNFNIWIKLRYTRMAGGNKAIGTYYNLPNVPHTMYFYNKDIPKTRGYGLHGAYWHNNFGHPMSHGCVNIGLENAEKLYAWAEPPTIGNTTYASVENPGTLITIYGVAPRE